MKSSVLNYTCPHALSLPLTSSLPDHSTNPTLDASLASHTHPPRQVHHAKMQQMADFPQM